MAFCAFCSSIPLKFFSSAREKQCTITHHPSFSALQVSGLAGCELCKLLLHAVQKRKEDGKSDGVRGLWSETGSVRVSSTTFDEQLVWIDDKEAGRFRGKVEPPGWCMAPYLIES